MTESPIDNNEDGRTARLPCRHCHGQGYLEIAQCIAWTKNERRCTLPSRSTTDPYFLVKHPEWTDLPPDFVAYCGLHGNAMLREMNRLRRLAARKAVRPHG
jgi:hypothetical protein